ncbi:hypothetical protein BD410DRAFT_792558 [Rickenella mellea]|uniref:Proteophosphoglycan ppg4 n=1 Tax=Rickenella mellea TaxID=50990 RepID=A0A4Y7PV05_9AGAM|nr:hypothetical protein BD410DRAFT_792558 [Rickenella mellea]
MSGTEATASATNPGGVQGHQQPQPQQSHLPHDEHEAVEATNSAPSDTSAQRTQSTGNKQTSLDTANTDTATDAQNGGGEGGGEQGEDIGGGYPPQRHAGQVGLGPEYGKNNHVGFQTRVAGIGERIAGAVKRDPALKEKGILHERGQKPEQEKDHDESNPFEGAKDDKSESQDKVKVKADVKGDEAKTGSGVTGANAGDGPRSQAQQTGTGTTANPMTHPTDEGAVTQAAHVAHPDDKRTRPGESEGRERAAAADIGSGRN